MSHDCVQIPGKPPVNPSTLSTSIIRKNFASLFKKPTGLLPHSCSIPLLVTKNPHPFTSNPSVPMVFPSPSHPLPSAPKSYPSPSTPMQGHGKLECPKGKREEEEPVGSQENVPKVEEKLIAGNPKKAPVRGNSFAAIKEGNMLVELLNDDGKRPLTQVNLGESTQRHLEEEGLWACEEAQGSALKPNIAEINKERLYVEVCSVAKQPQISSNFVVNSLDTLSSSSLVLFVNNDFNAFGVEETVLEKDDLALTTSWTEFSSQSCLPLSGIIALQQDQIGLCFPRKKQFSSVLPSAVSTSTNNQCSSSGLEMQIPVDASNVRNTQGINLHSQSSLISPSILLSQNPSVDRILPKSQISISEKETQISHIYREANGLADFLASFAVHSKKCTEFSGSNVLPVAGRLIQQQDQTGLPNVKLKRLLCSQRQGIG
ncbi:unnamed protein product [Ilex paraguariensis]|uniref:Uncharacterized protein n=1 Tax=Ilex paraguariensis TaxID=185542 RepID=A0ABC8U4G9_9AQUA